LLGAAVANHFPSCADTSMKRGFRNDATPPNGVPQFSLTNKVVWVVDQILKNIENLRFESTQHAAAMQIAPLSIEQTVPKSEDHGCF